MSITTTTTSNNTNFFTTYITNLHPWPGALHREGLQGKPGPLVRNLRQLGQSHRHQDWGSERGRGNTGGSNCSWLITLSFHCSWLFTNGETFSFYTKMWHGNTVTGSSNRSWLMWTHNSLFIVFDTKLFTNRKLFLSWGKCDLEMTSFVGFQTQAFNGALQSVPAIVVAFFAGPLSDQYARCNHSIAIILWITT